MGRGESPMCGVRNYPQLVYEEHEIMRKKNPLSARERSRAIYAKIGSVIPQIAPNVCGIF